LIGAFLLSSRSMKIIFYTVFYFFFTSLAFTQSKDSLQHINDAYQAVLSSEQEIINLLFYKHQNDLLANDLGPYGSNNFSLITDKLNKKTYFKSPYNNRSLDDLQGVKPFTNLTYLITIVRIINID